MQKYIFSLQRLKTDVSDTISNLSTEITNREDADTAINSRIDDVEDHVDTIDQTIIDLGKVKVVNTLPTTESFTDLANESVVYYVEEA